MKITGQSHVHMRPYVGKSQPLGSGIKVRRIPHSVNVEKTLPLVGSVPIYRGGISRVKAPHPDLDSVVNKVLNLRLQKVSFIKSDDFSAYRVDGQIIDRENIPLPSISKEAVGNSKELARLVKAKIIDTDGNVKKRITYEKFKKVLESICPNVSIEEETLTAFHCISIKDSDGGFLSGMPIGMIDLEGNKDKLAIQMKTLLRYHLVNSRNDASNVNSLEKFKKWKDVLFAPGLSVFANNFSLVEILHAGFPGIFKGFDPPLRMWMLPIDTKTGEGSRDLKKWQCSWILTHGTSAVNLDTRYFNISESKELDWYSKFNEHNACFDYKTDPDVHSLLDAIRLGAEGLGIEKPFGVDVVHGQLPTFFVRRENMWQEEKDGKREIDNVTEFLISKKLPYKDKYFDYFHVDKLERKLRPEKVKDIPWDVEYNNIAPGCLRSSKLTAVEALKRVSPELFGSEVGKAKLEEISKPGKWSSENGKVNFRRLFLDRLRKNGLKAELKDEGVKESLTFTVGDFRSWCSDNLIEGKTWGAFFKENGLESGLRHGTNTGSGNSIGNAIAVLFDVDKKISMKPFSVNSLIKQIGLSDEEVVQIPLLDKVEVRINQELSAIVQENIVPRIINYPMISPAAVVIEQRKTNSQMGTRILSHARAHMALAEGLRKTVFQHKETVVGLLKTAFKELDLDPMLLNDKSTFKNEEIKEKIRQYLVLGQKSFDQFVDIFSKLKVSDVRFYQFKTLLDTKEYDPDKYYK